MNIKYDFTNVNFRSGRNGSNIEGIVLHDTDNQNDSASGNANFFRDEYRGSSAHYFVDENEVVQVVREGDTSWHCGVANYGKYYNSNTIGIEMCVTNGKIGRKTKDLTIQLVRELMEKYGLTIDNVKYHEEVADTPCPKHLGKLERQLLKNEINGISYKDEDTYLIKVFTFVGKEEVEKASKRISELGYYNEIERK